MSEAISPQISDRICKHMNEDHADTLVLYAQVFGNSPETETAKMVSIDSEGMNLSTQANNESIPIRIKFEHLLKDAEDAHHTLIDMVKQAKKIQINTNKV